MRMRPRHAWQGQHSWLTRSDHLVARSMRHVASLRRGAVLYSRRVSNSTLSMRSSARVLELPLAGEQIVDRDADFRDAAKYRSELAGLDVPPGELVRLVGQRQVADLGGGCAALGQHELDELLDLGSLERFFLHIDEEWPRQRVVGALGDGLEARRDGALAPTAIDRHGAHLVLVRGVIRETEVSECTLVVLDALNERVVVFARRVVAAARLRLTVNGF